MAPRPRGLVFEGRPAHAELAPSAWVERWGALIPEGEVLDLACGTGRHTRLLARRAHPVLALDRDAAALATLEGLPGVRTLCADLEDGSPWPLAGTRFAGVVIANYLYRPLFARLIESVGD